MIFAQIHGERIILYLQIFFWTRFKYALTQEYSITFLIEKVLNNTKLILNDTKFILNLFSPFLEIFLVHMEF